MLYSIFLTHLIYSIRMFLAICLYRVVLNILEKTMKNCSVKIKFCTFAPNCGNSSVGRASASQAEGREFEPRLPLENLFPASDGKRLFYRKSKATA